MSRAAAEKKQRKVLENAQKKQRVAEAKAEKARQRAAAAEAKDWPAAPSLSLFDSYDLRQNHQEFKYCKIFQKSRCLLSRNL